MNNSKGANKYLSSIIALVIFLVVALLYFSPVLSGKSLSMHDVDMSAGNAKELQDYYKKTGEYSWWTNSVFGGMPANMIWGNYPNSLSSKIGSFIYNAFPLPVNVIFLLMVGFYILMRTLKKEQWIAIAASIAYAFGTYNLLFTEAGHISKILALAYAPALLAGFVLIFQKRYLLGTFVTALFLSLEIYANHLQITYYFIFILAAYFIYQVIQIFKNQDTSSLPKIIAAFAVAVLVGVGSHTMRLWNNMVYSKESTRGVSELTKSSVGNTGLDRDYAFGWSYGLTETINLIVPNLMGGGSVGSLDEDSNTFKTLVSNGVDANMASQFVQQLPLYFGNQSITSGPAYSGVLIVFLFVLGLFISKGRLKWIIAALAFFFIMLAWGSNFAAFNDFIFNTLPGYNKFRAVTMTLVIVHFLLVWGAANTLSDFFQNKNSWATAKKPILYTLGIIAAIMLMGYFSVNFVGPRDADFKASIAQSTSPEFAQQLANALQADRQTMAWSDVIRGFLLMGVFIGLIWAYLNQKFNRKFISLALALILSLDLITVGKRYFNNADFTLEKAPAEGQLFQPNQADLDILKDQDPNFKVINLATSFSSDARDSYFHKSLGGYHGAKLKKIQEIFDNALTFDNGQLNLAVLNMFNTKYIITNSPNGPVAQRNPEALGNAWFVDTLKVLQNADAELAELKQFNPASTAITQENQGLKAATFQVDTTDAIRLTSYAPNKLVYESNAKANKFAVFSEVYYRGNKDWKSYIDGKETSHYKVNYTLRGMEIPAGKHEIVFEYKPDSVEKGKMGDLVASIALVLLGLGVVYTEVKKK